MALWRLGKHSGTVVSDIDHGGPLGYDDREYYGGYMIAESCTAASAKLIVEDHNQMEAQRGNASNRPKRASRRRNRKG